MDWRLEIMNSILNVINILVYINSVSNNTSSIWKCYVMLCYCSLGNVIRRKCSRVSIS
jgi:hypothetical protein